MKKIITTTLLAFAVSGNAAWAEGKDKSNAENSGAECKIIPSTKEIRNGAVLEFGDLKIRIADFRPLHPVRDHDGVLREKQEAEVFLLLKVNGIPFKTSHQNPIQGLEDAIWLTDTDSLHQGMQKICGKDISFGLSRDKPELTVGIW